MRIYLENLISQIDSIEGDAIRLSGIPFDINPKKFLPLIAKNVSDEMLEKMADFLLIIAKDILQIRSKKLFLVGEIKTVEDETIGHTA